MLVLGADFTEMLTAAKFRIHSVWGVFLGQKSGTFSAKVRVFSAVSRALMCYAALVWGFNNMYDRVESLLRFALKNILHLPIHIPSYILHLETNIQPIFIHTLKLLLMFMHKILNFPDNRLPLQLAQETLKRNIFWAKGWRQLEETYDITLNTDTIKQHSFRDTNKTLDKINRHIVE